MGELFALRSFLARIVRGWKTILICVIVCAILMGGYKIFVGTQIMEPGTTSSAFTEKDRIELLKKHNSFLETELFMQLDPYNFYRTGAVYVIDVPDSEYREKSGVAALYMQLLQIPVLTEYVVSHLPDVEFGKSLNRLITVDQISLPESQNAFSVTVLSPDADLGNALFQTVDAYINEKYQSLQSLFGNHRIYQVEAFQVHTHDSSVAQAQLNLISISNSINTAYVEPAKEGIAHKIFSLRATVIYTIMGGIMGSLLGVGILLLGDLMRVTITAYSDISQFGAEHLCTIYHKARGGRIERIASKITGDTTPLSYDESLDMLAAKIVARAKEDQHLFLTGSVRKEQLVELQSAIQQKVVAAGACVNISFGANLNQNAAAIIAAKNADTIVLVEQIGCSKFPQIAQEIALLRSMNKQILGTVLLQ